MEESNSENIIQIDSQSDSDVIIKSNGYNSNGHADSKDSMSQLSFTESPVYEPEDMDFVKIEDVTNNSEDIFKGGHSGIGEQKPIYQDKPKRKLSDDAIESACKIQKRTNSDDIILDTQNLDEEVSAINSLKKKINDNLTRVKTPVKSSPRKVNKRSNSTEVIPKTPRTPKTPKARSASAELHKKRNTPLKKQIGNIELLKKLDEDKTSSSDSKEEANKSVHEESQSEMNDSQNFHLVLSPTTEDDDNTKRKHSSDPVVVRDRVEKIDTGKILPSRSEGYNYSDLSSNMSQQIVAVEKGKTTDQESTDSVCSISIDSPDQVPTVASKIISKLSNGTSSTPTDKAIDKRIGAISVSDSDNTPELTKMNLQKNKRMSSEFKMSNATTPSTISPLQNGHSLPINTPQVPVFDVITSYNEDGEFLSMYIVKTDNDMGVEHCKEYQRFSKRFTIDPYAGDVSNSNSPSSVTSTGMINLPIRTSFASTTGSSTSSNRTSDGAFVVPQPPRKSISHPASSTVKGYEALMKKLQDAFAHYAHIRDTPGGDRSNAEDKVSVGIQASNESASLSNGNASPEEISKYDKATPKSSLKKTRVRGRRPLPGKTKRAILPTQAEEPEYMHGMNSPEMVPTNGDTGSCDSKQDDKPLSSLVGTPKSVNKLKQKRSRPASPRPATPVEKSTVKQEYPGYQPDTLVLAKWVDKSYYSGKVLEITEPNKYLIKFDDGQTKLLIDDFIIFGNTRTLPLQGQSVYAMVDEHQNYEPGLVLGIDENECGTITYRCTTDGDTTVCVTASELYLTEDQAKSIKESVRPRSPSSAPTTPRRRGLRELDLDNIIQGPRSARGKGNLSSKKRLPSPRSPKASTSGLKSKNTPIVSRKRIASESSEMSESSNSAPPVRLEEVPGVEPEVQRTPRKIDGVKAGPLQLKGAARQNIGKKNSKLTKFENDEDTISQLGPIPSKDSKLFAGLHFLLTCTEPPKKTNNNTEKEARHYSSEEDGESTSTMPGTDTEDLEFSKRPFNKERLKEQLEAGGGVVYSHFDDVPKNKYNVCKLIAPRVCLTAKYIQCVAANIKAVTHDWVISCCSSGTLMDADAFILPPGWSIQKGRFANWHPTSGKRNASFFKDKVILICGDRDTFVKFWERVCSLAGATTREVNEEDLYTSGATALVTEWDCPHEVQNKANQDNIPLVSTTWVVQCLIEGRVIPPTSHEKFSFMYTEPE